MKYTVTFAPQVEFSVTINANSADEALDIAEGLSEDELWHHLVNDGEAIFEDCVVSVVETIA